MSRSDKAWSRGVVVTRLYQQRTVDRLFLSASLICRHSCAPTLWIYAALGTSRYSYSSLRHNFGLPLLHRHSHPSLAFLPFVLSYNRKRDRDWFLKENLCIYGGPQKYSYTTMMKIVMWKLRVKHFDILLAV